MDAPAGLPISRSEHQRVHNGEADGEQGYMESAKFDLARISSYLLLVD
jgi:hypothetical protein